MIKEIRLEDAMKREFDIQPKTQNRKFGSGFKPGDEATQMISK